MNNHRAVTGPTLAAWLAAVAIWFRALSPGRLAGEDRIEYRYEDYREDGNRIDIHTHGVYFEKELHTKVIAHGQFVYDSISGASPTGGYPNVGENKVPVNPFPIQDIRRAGALDLAIRWGGRHTTTPQIAYSLESDYESLGLALNHSIEFNQKNTTLNLGIGRNFDRVQGAFQPTFARKDQTDFIVGVNQLLSPKTHITINLTLGYSDGYLNDPYKGVNFYFPYPGTAESDWPTDANIGEKRPSHRFRQVLYTGITHYFDTVKAGIEADYRLSHDSFEVWANTISLTWRQKLGKQIEIAPTFRWYHQTEAEFYRVRVIGEPDFPNGTKVAYQDGNFVDFEGGPAFPSDPTGFDIIGIPTHPNHFSADYRLSEFEAFTVGISAHWKVNDHLSFELGYKRYEMRGLDDATPKDAYPKAHVITIGAGYWF